MMSECIVPNKWNLNQERQEQVEGESEERNRSSHVQTQQNLSYVVPMSNNYEVTTELTWENGQLSLHGLGGIVNNAPPHQSKQTWGTKPGDSTLESIVHQATYNNFRPQNHVRGHEETPKYSTNPLMPTSSVEKWAPQNSNMQIEHINPQCSNLSSMAESSGGKWRAENSSHMQVEHNEVQVNVQTSMPVVPPGGKWRDQSLQMMDEQKGVKLSSSVVGGLVNKRVRSESENYCSGRKSCNNIYHQEGEGERGSEPSACASVSATFCRDNRDAPMMTWASFESPPQSFKTARNNTDDDSACHDCSENQEGDRMTKGESFRSQSSARRSRAAAVHNQSERRRRDRINEKMRALQRLVPNASKTDKASMLDEVIEYLKQLQAQVQMMSNARNMPQMVMPLGMQQQLQMSLLARMGMGMGMGMTPAMGMIDVNNLARNLHHQPHSLIHAAAAVASLGGGTPPFVPPPFAMPTPMAVPTPTQLKPNVSAANMSNSVVPNFNDAYHTLLAQQTMNMDFFNKMAALYRQQANQQSNKAVNLSLPRDGQAES